jgi:tripartite-type tricarboxylate transporter receptor subunit TctC
MRRAIPAALALIGAALLMVHSAAAQNWPTRAIRFITVSAAGSTGDIIPRVVAAELSPRLGQPVTVENRPGGSGLVGATAGAHSAPDGYNMLLSTSGTMIVNNFVYAKMPFDTLRDFEPVAHVATVPLVLVVNPNSKFRAVKDLVAAARSAPGSVSFGSLGNGSTQNVSSAILKKAENIELVQVPYKGSPDAFNDIMSGRLTMMFDFIGFSLPHIRSGKLRALAVGTPQRLTALPDIPTMQELGYRDFDTSMWYASYMPAGTPREIVRRMSEEFRAVLGGPVVKEKFTAIAVEPGTTVGDQFAAFQAVQFKRWGSMVKELSIQVE